MDFTETAEDDYFRPASDAPPAGEADTGSAQSSSSNDSIPLLRSEPMSLMHIMVRNEPEVVNEAVMRIAQFSGLHPVDQSALNDSQDTMRYKQRFVLIDQLQRKMTALGRELKKRGIRLPPPLPSKQVDRGFLDEPEFTDGGGIGSGGSGGSQSDPIPLFVEWYEAVERELLQNASSTDLLEQQMKECYEYYHVLRVCKGVEFQEETAAKQHELRRQERRRARRREHKEISGNVELIGDSFDVESPARDRAESLSSNSQTGLLDTPDTRTVHEDSKLEDEDENIHLEDRSPSVNSMGSVGSFGEMKSTDGFRVRNVVCGVIPVTKKTLFHTLAYRVTRGNFYLRFIDIKPRIYDPASGKRIRKAVFYVVVIGNTLRKMVQRACEITGASTYPLLPTFRDCEQKIAHLKAEMHEKYNLYNRTQDAIRELLSHRVAHIPSAEDGTLTFETKTSPPPAWRGFDGEGTDDELLTGHGWEGRLTSTSTPDQQDGSTSVNSGGELDERKGSVIEDPAVETAVLPAHRSPFRQWERVLWQEKVLAQCMLQVRVVGKFVVLEGWVAQGRAEELRGLMQDVTEDSGQPVIRVFAVPPADWPERPPSAFPTTKYTHATQEIVNTYGVPSYGEINPGLFTLVTFPFLFGVMYGDMGHGLFLVCAALYLIYHEGHFLRQKVDRRLPEILGMVFGGRYMLLAMGCFAVYCGLIYNDCMSVALNLFGSQWQLTGTSYEYEIRDNGNANPYIFGMDPAWHGSTNELAFFNSFKMKLSVVLGVTHMSFGLILKLLNLLRARDTVGVWLEFVPQFLFLTCTFGYMVLLIVFKWCTDYTDHPHPPPNLIQTMIELFLSPGTVLPEAEMYEGQAVVQTFLMLVATLCAPVMLLGRPLYHKFVVTKADGNRARMHRLATEEPHDDHSDGPEDMFGRQVLGADDGLGVIDPFAGGDDELFAETDEKTLFGDLLGGGDGKTSHLDAGEAGNVSGSSAHSSGGDGGDAHGDAPGHSLSDIFIHNGIHTIEFILGTVSNTASYLRLWALSLAHAELSTVFWEKMIMKYGVLTESAVGVFVGMAMWTGATFGVLCCMDSLECFLHALRLHWVEFQSKFYQAEGRAFKPLSFDREGLLPGEVPSAPAA